MASYRLSLLGLMIEGKGGPGRNPRTFFDKEGLERLGDGTTSEWRSGGMEEVSLEGTGESAPSRRPRLGIV